MRSKSSKLLRTNEVYGSHTGKALKRHAPI